MYLSLLKFKGIPDLTSQFSSTSMDWKQIRTIPYGFTEEQLLFLKSYMKATAHFSQDDIKFLADKLKLDPKVIVKWHQQDINQVHQKLFEEKSTCKCSKLSRVCLYMYMCFKTLKN